MTSRQLRNQRREAERKARKLAYQQNRNPASVSAAAPNHSFSPNPDLFDEFSAEEQMEMMAIRARVHARAGIAASPERIASPVLRSDEPALLSEAKTQADEPAVLSEAKIQADDPAALSEANTQQRSGPTGPRTTKGKIVSSGNSLKHGLASGRVIIPGEDPAAFEALLSDLIAEHAPASETEQLLVQQMAQSWWLMQRAIRIQNETFTETRVDTHKLALFLRYQTTYERAFYKALNTLLKLNRTRQQAASSDRASTPEFVSQNRSRPQRPDEFVSQKRHLQAPQAPLTGTGFSLRGASAPQSDR